MAHVDSGAGASVTIAVDLTPRRKDEVAAVCMAVLLLRDME